MSKKFFISCKESRIENNRSFYGCFTLGPLEAGQSLTVANALRRTLLSECPGVGIISVVIENVNHEYSTLPGMRESVLDLLLNLKEVVFKKKKSALSALRFPLDGYTFDSKGEDETADFFYTGKPSSYSLRFRPSSSPQAKTEAGSQTRRVPQSKTEATTASNIYPKLGISFFKPVCGYVKVKGPGVIRAKDLKLPPFFECVDPEQYIATLAEDGFLSMKFTLMEGKGYFIQKNNNFINDQLAFGFRSSSESDLTRTKGESFDYGNKSKVEISLLKNRTDFLNQLKQFETSQSQSQSQSQSNKNKKTINEEKYSEISAFTKQPFLGDLSDKRETKTTNIPLTLDTVFNPVTKVSYIIEDFNNKISYDSKKKVDFLNDISSLIESSHYLKQNLPCLTHELSLNNKNFMTDRKAEAPPIAPQSVGLETHGTLSHRIPGQQADFSKFIENYTISEIEQLSNSLQPLKKQNSLHVIILEIWTNGSLHPREALFIAFKNLASVFLNLQKTKNYSSIYLNEASYQNFLS